MMNQLPENLQTLLEGYLDRSLNTEDHIFIESLLGKEPLVQHEYNKMKAAVEAVRHAGLRQFVKNIHQESMKEIHDGHATAARPPVLSIVNRTMRIAAGILLLAGMFGLYKFTSVDSKSVFNNHFQSYELGRTRSTAESGIERAFQNKKWNEVIALSGKAHGGKNDFLSGLALLETNQPVKAIQQFNLLLEKNKQSGIDLFNDEAEYYLALSYVRNNEPARAAALISKIRNQNGHLYQQKVQSANWTDLKMLAWKSGR
ncbi:MAG TPA: hypothetical protein VM012_05045 [Flavitalea sp.]|nr:hypothetical protein [Flavitalea sp.]